MSNELNYVDSCLNNIFNKHFAPQKENNSLVQSSNNADSTGLLSEVWYLDTEYNTLPTQISKHFLMRADILNIIANNFTPSLRCSRCC